MTIERDNLLALAPLQWLRIGDHLATGVFLYRVVGRSPDGLNLSGVLVAVRRGHGWVEPATMNNSSRDAIRLDCGATWTLCDERGNELDAYEVAAERVGGAVVLDEILAGRVPALVAG